MFSNDPYVHELYEMLLGDNVHWQDREAWIYSKNVYTRYPFQGALYGLPPEVHQGMHHRRDRGALRRADADASAAAARQWRTAAPTAPPTWPTRDRSRRRRGAANFEEFIYKVWGAGIAKHFAIPYNRKLWAVPLTEMETSWLGGRVPLPDLEEMIEGALRAGAASRWGRTPASAIRCAAASRR